MYKYGIEIFSSSRTVIPELPDCSAFGETEEEALKEAKIAIKLWLETAEKEGRKVPEPLGRALLAELHEFAAQKAAGI